MKRKVGEAVDVHPVADGRVVDNVERRPAPASAAAKDARATMKTQREPVEGEQVVGFDMRLDRIIANFMKCLCLRREQQ
jgi:hypothetical protein